MSKFFSLFFISIFTNSYAAERHQSNSKNRRFTPFHRPLKNHTDRDKDQVQSDLLLRRWRMQSQEVTSLLNIIARITTQPETVTIKDHFDIEAALQTDINHSFNPCMLKHNSVIKHTKTDHGFTLCSLAYFLKNAPFNPDTQTRWLQKLGGIEILRQFNHHISIHDERRSIVLKAVPLIENN